MVVMVVKKVAHTSSSIQLKLCRMLHPPKGIATVLPDWKTLLSSKFYCKPKTMGLSQVVVSCLSSSLIILAAVNAAPIRIDFTTCKNATYAENFLPNATILTYSCCPVLPTKPILTGLPPPMSSDIRIRPAAQCTDAAYKAKLERAYALMKALPGDDPRSLTQQWYMHCAHCGGAFFGDIANSSTAIDIHFSWLFLPWHRFYLYFHERILQSLLGDPTFSLNFWNWDGPFSVGIASRTSPDGKCLLAGQDFPSLYQDAGSSVYHDLRSNLAKGMGQFPFPSLTFSPVLSADQQYPPNITTHEWVQSNLNVMYNAMVSGGTTPAIFMGREYREGDLKGTPTQTGGAGILEGAAHASVHFWTGLNPPYDLRDMGAVATASRDPVFFAHHGNIDRLFQLWKDIGSFLGVDREYYNDPDFLNAEFLFYDEKKNLRRVSPKDALDTRNLGYVYQDTIYPWLAPNITSCATSDYSDTLAQALSMEAPKRAADGNYYLAAGSLFIIVLDRPSYPGAEEFLTISGITLDVSNNGGFDVYIDLLFPTGLNCATLCAEYCGRFMNMAVAAYNFQMFEKFEFKTSITKTLADIKVPTSATQLVFTLVTMTPVGSSERVGFSQISISNS